MRYLPTLEEIIIGRAALDKLAEQAVDRAIERILADDAGDTSWGTS